MRLTPSFVVLGAAAALVAVAAVAGAVTYDSVADEVGIDFQIAGEVHGVDEIEWPAFPEIMGGGACWADFDGDGYDDLYLVNQQFNPENPLTEGWIDRADPTNKLYINDGDGTFTDVTEKAGVASGRFGYGCSAADYDGDGDVDLFVSTFGDPEWGGNHLYRNEGDGSFTDVAGEAGVEMADACGDFPCMSTSSAWADHDNDGDLDLYVGNYVETTLSDLVRGPNGHVAQVNWLFRNEGDGTFTEVAEDAGVAGNPTDEEGSKTLGVVWFDHDLDGDLDLYVANDEVPNDFYENNGDGTFTERSEEAGVANPLAGMGVTAGDYDLDGYPDLFFTHYALEQNGFYRNEQDGTYQDRSGEDDLENSYTLVGWGTTFLDADRDGDLDIMLVNGHTEWGALNYNMKTQLMRNDPNDDPDAPPWDRTWVDVTAASGAGLAEARVSRGAAWSDYDLDGDTDLVVVNNANQSAQLLRASGVTDHWLVLRLREDGMNRHAVGARVALEAGGVTQVREVQAGSSYLSQNSLNLDFGLGSATAVDRITVQWPAGGTTTLTDVGTDQVIRLDRATGTYVTDPLSPLTTVALVGTEGANGWFVSSVTATVTAVDRGVTHVSGLAATDIAVGDGPWEPYAGEVFSFGEGTSELMARSLDHAGNLEPIRRTPINVDVGRPVPFHEVEGTAGDNGWFVSPNVTVTMGGVDAVSGVDEVRYRLGAGDWTTYEGPFTIEEDGEHTVEFVVRDVAGNEAGDLFGIKLDGTDPDARVAKPGGGRVYVGNASVASLVTGPATILVVPDSELGSHYRFTVLAAAADATSGVARVAFLLNGSPVRVDEAGPRYSWEWDTRLSPSGLYEVRVVVFDVAGNSAVARVRVALVSGTLEGTAATIDEGPSLYADPGSGDEGPVAPAWQRPSVPRPRPPRS